MTLSAEIDKVRRNRASRANRERQQRAEKRMDEIVKVAGVADDYAAADRAGDLAIARHFTELYRLVDTDAERHAVARAFAVWTAAERREDLAVRDSVGESVELLKSHNPLFIDGSFVPSDSDGAA